jgi:hypothetical protein
MVSVYYVAAGCARHADVIVIVLFVFKGQLRAVSKFKSFNK